MIDFEKIYQIVALLLAESERPLTDQEKSVLREWLDEDPDNRVLYDSLKNTEHMPDRIKKLATYDSEKAWSKFVRSTKDKRRHVSIPRFIWYAAVVIPLIFGVYFIYQSNTTIEEKIEIPSGIQPGTGKAILELTDGSIVNLEKEDKQIREYDGTIVQNTQSQLIYKSITNKQNAEKNRYHTIRIPRGGEFQLTLSDGTKVWLNAETILKYPVSFSNTMREVFVEGEAFFEVAKDVDRPFVVQTRDMKVNVYGTSFNIKAYPDEKNLTTTLVSGKISLTQSIDDEEYLLLPNEQAIVTNLGIIIEKVNVDQFIAWKNGRILFEENTMEEIFNELSRWYNIEIAYANDDIRKLKFSIDMIRYSEFDKILEIIELTKKVKFEVNGNKVIIK